MKHNILGSAMFVVGMAAASVAFAQSGQIGPAKTPNGSMPAAPSNSTPQSGSMSGSPMAGAGQQNDNGGQAFSSRQSRNTYHVARRYR